MRIRSFILPSLIFSLAVFLACDRSTEKRKIKLSDQSTTTRTDDQLTTTIHLEPILRRAVAVMFFENKTGDENLQWLQKGLTEMFIRSLSQSQHISVLSTDRLNEIFERLGKGASPEEMDMNMAAIVAREANVEALLTGNVSKNGDSLRIDVRVHEPNQGQILREASVEGPGLEDIFGMVDQLTQKIRSNLYPSIAGDDPSKSLTEISTNSLEAWHHYIDGVELNNRLLYEDAMHKFEAAIKMDPTFVSANINLCRIYRRRGDTVKAYGLLKKLKSFHHKATPQERYQIDILDANFRRDDIARVKTIQEWLREYPEDRDAHYTLALMYHYGNNYDLAIQYYKNALKTDPNYKIAYNQLGYLYAFIGNFSEAISTLDKYKKLADDEPNPYDSLGEIYFIYGNYKKAEKYFKKALQINENFIGSLGQLAKVYFESGKYKKALKTYETYLEKASDEATQAGLYAALAQTYWRLGVVQKAIENYKASLEKNPFNFTALERLNDIYSGLNTPSKADEILQQTYQQLMRWFESDLMRLNGLFSMCALSIRWGVRMEETIAALTEALARSASTESESLDPANLTSLKFFLTLLYIKTDQENKIHNLWYKREIIPEDLWDLFKEARNVTYSGDWKYFTILNKYFYQDMNEGLSFYEPLITLSETYGLETREMMFRLLLIDLFYHSGDIDEAQRQLRTIGMPPDKTWMVIGPFDNKDGFRKKYPPEKSISLDKIYREESWEVAWQHSDDGLNDGFIDLRTLYDKYCWSVGYGLIYVLSPDKKDVQLRFGTDDGSKLWLNDRAIWTLNKWGPAIYDNTKLNVSLKRGLNKILIKVCNTVDDWGFFFRITDREGNGIPDIQFVSADGLEENP